MAYNSYFRFDDDNTMMYTYPLNHHKRNGWAKYTHLISSILLDMSA